MLRMTTDLPQKGLVRMKYLVDLFLANIPAENKENYKGIAEKATALEYNQKKDKTQHLGISFSPTKYKNTVWRFINDKEPSYRLKFYATKNFSGIFDQSIKWIIEKCTVHTNYRSRESRVHL